VVDKAMLRRATAIFAFDLDNLVRTALCDPLVLGRTHLLGALRSDGPMVIRDPHGREQGALDAALTQIIDAIDHADAGRSTEPS
jgi:hypothetical protein